MKHLRWVAAVLLALGCSCTQIPVTGPVEEVPLSADPIGIDIAPEPPEAGASPRRLIDGFLLAMADPEGNYEVARKYLTPEAAAQWEPEGAAVYDGKVIDGPDWAKVEGTRIGKLDARGHFTLGAEEISIDFGLVEIDGQWRINLPPDGLLLSRYLFERYYAQASLYFLSRSGEHVVPDLIHLPESRLTPQAVVESLLGGPALGLQAAVMTAIPPGVSMGAGGASMNSDGVVTVDLQGLETSLSDDSRRRMGAQLLWSLTSIPRATGLIVTSSGNMFPLPGANAKGALELPTQQGYQVLSRATTTDLFGISNARPGRLTSTNTFLSWPDPQAHVEDIAVSLDASAAALITTDRTAVLLGSPEGPWVRIHPGYSNLRSPQFVAGTLWMLGDDAAGTSALIALGGDGSVTSVAAQLPAGARLIDFSISPTTARAALVINLVGENRLGIAIMRPGPTHRLGPWQELPLRAGTHPLADVTEIAWREETTLALLASVGEVASVYTARIDGTFVEDLGSVAAKPVALTAMPRLGGGALAVRADSGATWRYEPRTRWNRATDVLTAITYAS